MVQLIFNKGYAGEIKIYTIPSNNKSYSIEEKKNNKLILPTYEDIMQKPVSLAISYLSIWQSPPPSPWTQK